MEKVRELSGEGRCLGSVFSPSPMLLVMCTLSHFVKALVHDDVHIFRFHVDTFPGVALASLPAQRVYGLQIRGQAVLWGSVSFFFFFLILGQNTSFQTQAGVVNLKFSLGRATE